MNILGSMSALAAVTADAGKYSSGFSKLAEDANFGERLVYGLQVAGIGIAVVFLILIILMVIIQVFKVFFTKKEEPASITKESVQPVIDTGSGGELSDKISDSELVAIATSAIAASRDESECGFDVISITKIS